MRNRKHIKSVSYLIIFLLIIFANGCDTSDSKLSNNESFGNERKEQSGRPYQFSRQTGSGKTYPSNDPIKDALQLIQLDKDNLSRRHAYEQGYITLARLPLIDHLSESPFKLQRWADQLSLDLQKITNNGANELITLIVGVLNGSISSTNIKERPTPVAKSTYEAYQYLCRKFGEIPRQSDLKNIKNTAFTPKFDKQLGAFIQNFADAAMLAEEAYSDLNQEQRKFLISDPERYFFSEDNKFNFLTAPTHTQFKVVSLARKIKFDRLFKALNVVAKAVDEFTQYLSDESSGKISNRNPFLNGKNLIGTILSLASPIGDIVILGPDDNEYSENAALVIDLGGNDRYFLKNNIETQPSSRVSILIDLSGNDSYGGKNAKIDQGAGVLSIDILADLSGEDHYYGSAFSQGCGLYGVGLLLDSQGNDIYQLGLMGQGFGVFGIGILADGDGSDRYIISAIGQGAGSTMGFGGLIDRGGNDIYRADLNPDRSELKLDSWNHAQGVGISVRSPNWHRQFSMYGGVGFLSDGTGDDSYYCAGGNCMGAGYFMSAGALVDHSGNDRYFPENGNGLGFAVHLASGVLIDKEGNDVYFAKNDSGGVGADHSVGLLVDYRGNDIYGPAPHSKNMTKSHSKKNNSLNTPDSKMASENELAYSSYASASRADGLGVLLDYGGNDQYFAQQGVRSASCGAVIPPPDPQDWSHALLIDMGGSDRYFPPGRKNNYYHIDLKHGVSYDIDLPNINKTKVGYEKKALDRLARHNYEEASILPGNNEELLQLIRNDNFSRFGILGKIVQSDASIIKTIIEMLKSSTDDELNFSLMEALNHFILKKQMNHRRSRYFAGLLHAINPSVRIYAARTLGMWKVTSSASAMRSALRDADPGVREHVMWAMGYIGTADDLITIHQITLSETSIRCKRQAIQTYHRILDRYQIDSAKLRHEVMEGLLAWISDPDPIVRKGAAVGLRYIGESRVVIETLKDSLNDENIYVKRASAKSLALLGQKEGVPVLIDSLKFPSIDTEEYYDQDLVKDIAFYCGTDFPESVRYKYETWNKWWVKNGHQVDVGENLAIMKKIDSAFQQEDEDNGLRIFENLLHDYPNNVVIKFRFIKFCQDWITYRLLSQEKITRNTLERSLKLQKKVVELSPEDPKSLARLASFLAKLSRFDDAIKSMTSAVKLAPNNLNYQKTLNYYKTLNESHTAKKR